MRFGSERSTTIPWMRWDGSLNLPGKGSDRLRKGLRKLKHSSRADKLKSFIDT